MNITGHFRVGWLQWAVGIYCTVFGTLALVAPHQVRDAADIVLQNGPPWGGAAFVLAGVVLVVATARANRTRTPAATVASPDFFSMVTGTFGILDGLFGVLVLDSSHRVRYCNREAGLLLQIDPTRILGKSAKEVSAEFVPPLWKLREALHHWPTRRARPDNRLSFDVSVSDDNPCALAIDMFSVGDHSGGQTELVILVRDVTSSTLLTALREREKFAMDLHDGIIQSLYALALGLSAKERLARTERDARVREELHLAIERVDAVITEIRQYISRLRLNQLDGRGLDALMLALVTEYEENGLARPEFIVDRGIAELLGADATTNVLQIVREATSNAIRHAGATSVKISFHWHGDNGAILTIVDNGSGFDPASERQQTGQGVTNMEERARMLGGSLAISSKPGRGTEIRLKVPLSSRKVAV